MGFSSFLIHIRYMVFNFLLIKKQYKILAFSFLHPKIYTDSLFNYKRSTLSKIEDNITLPDVIPPQIKKDAPVVCLYDSRRDFEEQFKILYDLKITKKKVPSN